MSELESHIVEIMRGGIKKFNVFLDQIPDEFFGLQDSSKDSLQKNFKELWEENPYQTAKQLIDQLITKVVNDRTCPDGNALRQILKVGVNTDFAKPDLPDVPLFLGEMTPEELSGPTIKAKRPPEIN